MVKARVASVIAVLALAVVGAAGVDLFTSEEGRFTILFASKPGASQQVIPTPAGNLTMHIFTAAFPAGTGEMMVSYSDYPAPILAAKTPDAMLDASVTGTIRGMKATLGRSGRLTQAGAPGREFDWTATGNDGKTPLKGQGRTFLVGPRLYQVLIVGKEKGIGWDVYDGIFQSFKFKPAPGTTPAAAPASSKGAAPRAMTRSAAPAKGATPRKAAAGAQAQWFAHSGISFEGPWNVQMPTRPRHTTEPGLFGVRTRNVHVASDGKLTYTLKIQTTPDAELSKGKEPVLEAARDKLAEEVGGKVVEESDGTLGGAEGRAYRLDVAGPKPMAVVARAAILGKRTVVLSVAGDRAAVAGPSAGRFFDSFQVENR